jgi:hypothetical protein
VPRSPVWFNRGIYTSPMPNENAVQPGARCSLGNYRPGIPGDVTILQNIVRSVPPAKRSYTILSPIPAVPPPWWP